MRMGGKRNGRREVIMSKAEVMWSHLVGLPKGEGGRKMQKDMWMRAFGVVAFLLLVSCTLWAAGPEAHDFRASIPDGLYLYNELGPTQDSIWFAPIVLVEKGRLVDPYGMGQSRKGRARIEKLLKGKAFNAFVGSDLLGRQEEADWGTSEPESLVGKRQLARNISMREEFPGMSFKDIYAKMPMYAVNAYAINFGCPRPLLAPPSFAPSRKIEFLPITVEDKEKAVEAVRSAFFGRIGLKELERKLEREGLPRCTFPRDSGGTLYSLQAFDIDNNGKKDLVGVYTIDATGKRPGGGACGIRYEMLFVLMDTGRIDMLASNGGVFPGTALGGVIDIDGDGILEVVTLTEMSIISPEDDQYEDGRRLSISRYDGNGWKTIYRTVPIYGGTH